MVYGKKTKKTAREMKSCEGSVCGETQHKVPKVVDENKKIKPKEVFGDNYNSKSSKAKQTILQILQII
jgi:hypothetical protein